MAAENTRAQTARERARVEITSEILDAARTHLERDGAAALSLRAIARELGFSSSAVYRYVSSRDDLLTELIVASYDDLGVTAESAAERSVGTAPALRWSAVAGSIRRWALSHPHEWSLLFGSPVPGYSAPDRTTLAGTRASLALISVLRDAAGDGWRPAPEEVPKELVGELVVLRDVLDLPGVVDPSGLVRIVAAWSQLLGLISLEVFGQTRNMVSADELLFDATLASMTEHLGLSQYTDP